MRHLPVIVLVLSLAVPASATNVVTIFADQAGTQCEFTPPVNQLVELYVFVLPNDNDVSAARFRAPKPDCFDATYLNDFTPYFRVGDSQSGVVVSALGCQPQGVPVLVLTMNFFTNAPLDGCCLFTVEADPLAQTGQVEVFDCSAVPIPSQGGTLVLDDGLGCPPPAPANPFPPDGATAAALDAQLDWDWSGSPLLGCILGSAWNDVYFGTSPNPPLVGQMIDITPYDPGLLQAGTTYYWRIVTHSSPGGSTSGPVWSFETEATVAAQPSTWSRIKGLYR